MAFIDIIVYCVIIVKAFYVALKLCLNVVLEVAIIITCREERLREGEALTLYHQTSKQNAEAIRTSGKMLLGRDGKAGAGIYFATSREATYRKAQKRGVILTARVKVGALKTVCRPNILYELPNTGSSWRL